jgi:hypothetical protein
VRARGMGLGKRRVGGRWRLGVIDGRAVRTGLREHSDGRSSTGTRRLGVDCAGALGGRSNYDPSSVDREPESFPLYLIAHAPLAKHLSLVSYERRWISTPIR